MILLNNYLFFKTYFDIYEFKENYLNSATL